MNDPLRAETERLCNRLMSSDPDFDDCAEAADHIRALQAEVDRLTIQRDEARKLASEWSNEGGAKIQELQVECDALRVDAERLDWLEKQNKSTDPCRAMACVTWNIGHDWETRERLRPEIDEAINRERGG